MTVTYTINYAISDALETWLVSQTDFVSIDRQANITHVTYNHASETEENAFKALLAKQIGLEGENVNTSDLELFTVSGVITPDALFEQTNNYNPPGLATASTIRQDTDAEWSITGIAGGYEGRVLTIHNISEILGNIIVLPAGSGNSDEENRFEFGSSLSVRIKAGSSATLRYDGIDQRWRLLNGAIADDIIGSENILPNSIGESQILDEAVSGAKLAKNTEWNLGIGTGVQIGTSTTQKLGFFEATPIVQPAANADTSGATLGQLETEVNQLKQLLRDLGLMAT